MSSSKDGEAKAGAGLKSADGTDGLQEPEGDANPWATRVVRCEFGPSGPTHQILIPVPRALPVEGTLPALVAFLTEEGHVAVLAPDVIDVASLARRILKNALAIASADGAESTEGSEESEDSEGSEGSEDPQTGGLLH